MRKRRIRKIGEEEIIPKSIAEPSIDPTPMEMKLEKTIDEFFSTFKEMLKILKGYKEDLEKITLTNEAIEDTTLNMLVAIRQNETLRAEYGAVYPAQKGLPEMRVIGSHPLGAFSSKRKQKEKSC